MQTRNEKITAFGNAHREVAETLRPIPRSAWKFKPSEKEWSIHQVLIHLADTEANAYVRFLKGVAEPGGTLMVMDQEVWADNLLYHEQDPDLALELFRLLRLKTAQLIERLPQTVWEQQVNHPEAGLITLDDWLTNYAAHAQVHIRQIKRVYEQYKAAQLAAV